VALGPHVPEWQALREELARLANASGAWLCAVLSIGNVLWCSSHVVEDIDELARDVYATHVAPIRTSLLRGAEIDHFGLTSEGVCYLRSFAGIYVLVLWREGYADARRVRRSVLAALPRVEGLTLSLPPPSPDSAEGAGKQRA
jgi:hypothetical protein